MRSVFKDIAHISVKCDLLALAHWPLELSRLWLVATIARSLPLFLLVIGTHLSHFRPFRYVFGYVLTTVSGFNILLGYIYSPLSAVSICYWLIQGHFQLYQYVIGYIPIEHFLELVLIMWLTIEYRIHVGLSLHNRTCPTLSTACWLKFRGISLWRCT